MTDMPLKGVVVIEFAIHGAGCAVGKVLADWGADVIKVETPSGDVARNSGLQLNLPCTEESNIHFEMLSGNKRSIVIDMKTETGREIMERLLAKANIFFSNFRMKALYKFGLDYESVSQRHPHIIWGHLSGYGTDGPLAGAPGFDVVSYWAKSGLLLDFTEKDSLPNTAPFGVGDFSAGAMLAGALAACLYQQEKTGRGQKVMNSLYGHAIWTAGSLVQSTQHGDQFPKTRKQAMSPFINSYRCKDEWFFCAVMDYAGKFPLLCEMIGRPELAEDPRFATLGAAQQNKPELIAIFDEWFADQPWEKVDRLLTEADIVHTKIAHFADIAEDPQAQANGYVYDFTTRTGGKDIMVSTPVKFGANEPAQHRNAPLLGEQTEEVLRELGYTETEIAAMQETGAVRQHA